MQRVRAKSERRERERESREEIVLLNVDTQLGAFGPGADPTRSRAAYPPPRLAVNLFVFCCWHLGSLDFASWRLDLGVLEASWRQDWASWRPD